MELQPHLYSLDREQYTLLKQENRAAGLSVNTRLMRERERNRPLSSLRPAIAPVRPLKGPVCPNGPSGGVGGPPARNGALSATLPEVPLGEE